jgi:hypothetical protein
MHLANPHRQTQGAQFGFDGFDAECCDTEKAPGWAPSCVRVDVLEATGY